jgi:methionyl-tRNA synthetase
VPQAGALTAIDQKLQVLALTANVEIDSAFADFAFHRALEAVRTLIVASNKYVVEVAPWTLAKAATQGDAAAQERLQTVLYVLLETLRLTSHYLAPFLPNTAATLAVQLGLAADCTKQDWTSALAWGQLAPGTLLPPAAPLFPKQSDEVVD